MYINKKMVQMHMIFGVKMKKIIIFLLLSIVYIAQIYSTDNTTSAEILEKSVGGRFLLSVYDMSDISIDDRFSIYNENNTHIGYGRFNSVRDYGRFNAKFQQLTGWDVNPGYYLADQTVSDIDFGFRYGVSWLKVRQSRGGESQDRNLAISSVTVNMKYNIAKILNISQLFAMIEYSYGTSWGYTGPGYPNYRLQSPNNSKFDPGYQTLYVGLSKYWWYEKQAVYLNWLVGNVDYKLHYKTSYSRSENVHIYGLSFKPNLGVVYMYSPNLYINVDVFTKPFGYKKGIHTIKSESGINIGVNYFPLSKPIPGNLRIDLRGEPSLYTYRSPRIPPTQAERPVDFGNLENVLERAITTAFADIEAGNRVAIVHFIAENNNLRSFVLGELEHILRTKNYQIVATATADTPVDDSRAINIGSSVNANYVITGSIDGEDRYRRLRLRVLNVETGLVVSTASEAF